MLEKRFNLVCRLALLFSMLVVLAGSIVRTTGSGMGCPDWPKCFGYWIPPSDVDQILWHPRQGYHKGEMIIQDESLWRAKSDFVSEDSLDLSNWEAYTKHDYALFNSRHTWTEYFNRLTGVLAGIPVLLMVFISALLWWRKRIVWPFLLSLATLFLFGFEAWLGKVVVEGNLIPFHITMHMLGAALIVILLVYLIYRSASRPSHDYGKRTRQLVVLSLVLTILQVLMGTQVREQVDFISHASDLARVGWIDALPLIFKVHRSFSIGLLLLAIYIWTQNNGRSPALRAAGLYLFLLVLIIISGVALTYAGMPPVAQPLHLLLGMGLVGLQFYMYLQVFQKSKGLL